MEESGIAHGGHDVGPLRFGLVGVIEPGRLADGGAHAKDRVHRPQVQPQCIAADVAGVNPPGRGLFDGEKTGPVGASGAEGGPSAGGGRHRDRRRGLPGEVPQNLPDPLGEQLADPVHMARQLSPDLSPIRHLHLDDPHRLFDDQDLFVTIQDVGRHRVVEGKGLDHLIEGQPIPKPHLPKDFRDMGRGHAGNQHRLVSLGPVIQKNRRRGPIIGDGLQFFLQFSMELKPEPGGGRPPGRVLVECDGSPFPGNGTQGRILTGMADPGGGPDHHRNPEGLGQFIGQPRHFQGLGGGGRVEHRDLGHHGHEAAVLFRLGGMGAGVVGADDDEAALGSHIGRAHEGVRGHVEPHLLHGDGGPEPGYGPGIGDFKGHLFVDRPLDVHLQAFRRLQGRHRGEDLRRRRAGIGGRHSASVLHQSPGQGGVAQQEFFCNVSFQVFFQRCLSHGVLRKRV